MGLVDLLNLLLMLRYLRDLNARRDVFIAANIGFELNKDVLVNFIFFCVGVVYFLGFEIYVKYVIVLLFVWLFDVVCEFLLSLSDVFR